MLAFTRDGKRCLPIIILLINRSAASVQQEGRGLQMPEPTRDEKRCLAIIIYAVNRHPSIKVQHAQRHVAVSRCAKQPSLADLTASLTQRKNAEATAVRHHIQARSVHQRNDTLVIVESASTLLLRAAAHVRFFYLALPPPHSIFSPRDRIRRMHQDGVRLVRTRHSRPRPVGTTAEVAPNFSIFLL